MRPGRFAGAGLVVLGVFLAAAAATAQEPAPKGKPYALIFGTVWGPDNRPVYGARVQIRRADGGTVKGGDDLSSDHQGEFALRLPAEAADYVVRVTAKKGKRKLVAEVKAHINFDERVDVGLHLTE